MTDTFEQYKSRKHFGGLDGLRALAIVAVVWHHSVRPDLLPMAARGFTGVDLFFVLSGYLIVTLVVREKERRGRVSLLDFWMRRFLRLMPVYYLLLFGLLAVYLIAKPDDPDTTRLAEGLPVYAFYLSNWFHPNANNLSITWSLATEEQFYLVWPLVEAFFAPFAAAAFWIAAVIVNQLINFGILDPAIDAAFGVGTADSREILAVTFTPILMGVGLARLLHRKRGFDIARKVAGFPHAPLVFAALLLVLFNLPAEDISGLFRLTLHILMTLWVASIVLAPSSPVTSILDWRPIAFVGAVSYGMYLYHLWCIHIADKLLDELGLPHLWLQFPIALAATVAVSAVSYYLYEKRFLDLRKRFRK